MALHLLIIECASCKRTKFGQLENNKEGWSTWVNTHGRSYQHHPNVDEFRTIPECDICKNERIRLAAQLAGHTH